MPSQQRGLIYYRALDEFRRIYRPSGPILDKIKFACYIVLIPALLVVMSEVSSAILATVRTHMRTEEGGAVAAFPMVMLLSVMFLTSTISELLREMGFAKDQILLRVCPIPHATLIRYRLTFAVIRNLPFALALLWLPIRLMGSLVASGPARVALIAFIFACFAWLGLLGLCTATAMRWATNRWNISPHAVFAAFFVSSLILGCLTLILLMQPEGWTSVARRFRYRTLSISSMSAALGLFATSGWLLYLATLQMWPLAARPIPCEELPGHIRRWSACSPTIRPGRFSKRIRRI